MKYTGRCLYFRRTRMQQSATPMKATCPRQEEKPVHVSCIPASINHNYIVHPLLQQNKPSVPNMCASPSREKAICIGCALSVSSGALSSLVATIVIAAAAAYVTHLRVFHICSTIWQLLALNTRTLRAYVNITCVKLGTFSPHTSATVT